MIYKEGFPIKNLPNLFDFATSELSQDAFICWLSEWANPKLATVDDNLVNVAQDYLSFLCDYQIERNEIKSVKTYRQRHKIDVLIDIELKSSKNNHLILVEDKTGSGQHGGQLDRYREAIKDDLKPGQLFERRHLHLIYYKTHDHITYDLSGFRNIKRADILKVLESELAAKITNNIFRDYVLRLRSMEDTSLSFQNITEDKWNYAQWSGFFMSLCRELGNGANFGYVSNKGGGFIGAWFGWLDMDLLSDNESVYFQINAYPGREKHHDLTIRVSSLDKSHTITLKDKILPSIRNKLDHHQIDYSLKNIKPGKSMRILSIFGVDIPNDENKVELYAAKLRNLYNVIKEH